MEFDRVSESLPKTQGNILRDLSILIRLKAFWERTFHITVVRIPNTVFRFDFLTKFQTQVT